MTTTLYGIKNCDTIKKARQWLEQRNIDYRFHDFRVDGIDARLITHWLTQLDWQNLLNTRGTTWRKLPEDQRAAINEKKAIALMLEQPAIIKRPVLTKGKQHFVGFKEDAYADIF